MRRFAALASLQCGPALMISAAAAVRVPPTPPVSPSSLCELETKWLRVPLDHFSSFGEPRATFQMRWLDCTAFCPKDRPLSQCPVLLYPGNEGTITGFANASGQLFDLGKALSVRVIFAEERYYGESVPPTAGNRQGDRALQPRHTVEEGATQGTGISPEAPDPDAFQFLSTEQVLADYAALLQSLAGEAQAGDGGGDGNAARVDGGDDLVGAEAAAAPWESDASPLPPPTVAIGGSYGGMLAVYLRLKYPWLVAGAVGSSAPIAGGPGGTPPSSFYDIVAADFACAGGVREGFLATLAALRGGRADEVAQALRLCDPLPPDDADAHDALIGLVQSMFGTLAELDYPYPVNFAGSSLPGHPAEAACDRLAAAPGGPMAKLAAAAGVAVNASGRLRCLALDKGAVFEQFLPGLFDGAWAYQRCSEVVLPCEVSDANPMFLRCSEYPLNCWNATRFAAFCRSRYGVIPDPSATAARFGQGRIASSSNILLSNGELDPWRGGGVQANVSASVTAVVIAGSAHHLDLRASDPHDPPAVTAARRVEADAVRAWLKQAEAHGL